MNRTKAAGLVLSLSLAAPLATAPAVAATDPTGPALTRIANGNYDSKDLRLIRSNPRLAAKVPDPTQPTQLHVRSERSAMAARSADGSCGWWVDVWFRKRSLLGRTLYKWHHKVVYCKTGSRITKWQNRYDYLTDAAGVVYFRELEVNEKGGKGSASAWSHRQRHIEFCVARYGCYASLHPWSRIRVYAEGGYKYKGDNA